MKKLLKQVKLPILARFNALPLLADDFNHRANGTVI